MLSRRYAVLTSKSLHKLLINEFVAIHASNRKSIVVETYNLNSTNSLTI